MKVLKLIGLMGVMVVFFSCNTTENNFEETQSKTPVKAQDFERASYKRRPPRNIPRYSNTELIVQFRPGLTDLQKNGLREQYGVLAHRACAMCLDGEIEKWFFEEGIDIEHKSLGIQSGSGGPEGEIIDVDYEFNFTMEFEDQAVVDGVPTHDYLTRIVPSNTGVTIAVLDTGINSNFPAFEAKFLYNASTDNILGEPSGWDFVNEDPDFNDDYWLVHGSAVSYIVNNHLRANEIPHQLLPVKVCDANGVASYFNILCGLNYALTRAQIVQMSLGWYDDGSGEGVNTIFSNLLSKYEKKVLVVTSAGNSTINNDAYDHYPSSYPQDNVLAIAAATKLKDNITDFSNYGTNSVDFFAVGEDVEFYDMDMLPVPMSGTSFAAPFVAAKAAEAWYNVGMTYTPAELVEYLRVNGTPVVYDKSVQYNRLIE